MNETFPQEAQEIMNERFGHDILIGLATIDDNVPDVRAVNAYYRKQVRLPIIECGAKECAFYRKRRNCFR